MTERKFIAKLLIQFITYLHYFIFNEFNNHLRTLLWMTISIIFAISDKVSILCLLLEVIWSNKSPYSFLISLIFHSTLFLSTQFDLLKPGFLGCSIGSWLIFTNKDDTSTSSKVPLKSIQMSLISSLIHSRKF